MNYTTDELLRDLLTTDDDAPCICNSGRLFKDCHKIRNRKIQNNPNKAFYEIININQKRLCLMNGVSECDGAIIKAHSVSRKYLLNIADNGHVLSFLSIMNSKDKVESIFSGELPDPIEIGIGRASTFTGLCRKHDNELFSCFEDSHFTCQENQVLALHLRSILKEIYVKQEMIRKSVKSIDYLNDGGSLDVNIERSMKHIQSRMGQDLALRDLYSELSATRRAMNSNMTPHYIIFQFNENFPIANSSIVNPGYDLNGNQVQDYAVRDDFMHSFGFNSFSEEGLGYVVLSWVYDSDRINKFMKSLKERANENYQSILCQLPFGFSENQYLNIKWFMSLSHIKRERLKKIFFSELRNDITGSDTARCFRVNMDFNVPEIVNIYSDAEYGL